MSRRTPSFGKMSRQNPGLTVKRPLTFGPMDTCPWYPLSDDKAERLYQRELARRNKAGGKVETWEVHSWYYNRESIKSQIEAFEQIAEGKGTFRYRCGGLHGEVHRIVITRKGHVAFPDHTDIDTDVAGVIQALGEDHSAPTCVDIREALRAPSSRYRDNGSVKPRVSRIMGLWGPAAVLSDLPPWAQALVWAIGAREEYHRARRDMDLGKEDPQTVAFREMAQLEIAQADLGTFRETGWKRLEIDEDSDSPINFWSTLKGSDVLTLAWPSGYEAWLATRCVAKHNSHYDAVLKVVPMPRPEILTRPEAYMAFTVCRGETKGEREPYLNPSFLEPDGDGWKVRE